MSQSVILISPARLQIAELSDILKERWAAHHWFTPQSSPTLQIQEVSEGVSYFSVDELDSAAAVAEYQENEDLPLSIRKQLDGRRCFMLTFNDERLFMKVVSFILERLAAQQDEMWLDNGYGALIPARTFAEEAKRDPGWQWRQFHQEG